MSLPENLATLHEKVTRTAKAARREPAGIRLMAVSKSVEAARVEEALTAGQRLFGENRVQEAKAKWPGLRAACPDIDLHLIGPLQTNKVKDAVALFDAIDTLDRPALAEVLAREMRAQNRRLPLLIEVNIGSEAQKHGCAPASLPALLQKARDLGLEVRGLMAIPPLGKPPEPYFKELASLATRYGLPEISMGMSGDFEAAIACGATTVRLGTAIFGERRK